MQFLDCLLKNLTGIEKRLDETDKGLKVDVSANVPYDAVYIRPAKGTNLPLVVLPHGGPHSAHTLLFLRGTTFMVNCGYALLKGK